MNHIEIDAIFEEAVRKQALAMYAKGALREAMADPFNSMEILIGAPADDDKPPFLVISVEGIPADVCVIA